MGDISRALENFPIQSQNNKSGLHALKHSDQSDGNVESFERTLEGISGAGGGNKTSDSKPSPAPSNSIKEAMANHDNPYQITDIKPFQNHTAIDVQSDSMANAFQKLASPDIDEPDIDGDVLIDQNIAPDTIVGIHTEQITGPAPIHAKTIMDIWKTSLDLDAESSDIPFIRYPDSELAVTLISDNTGISTFTIGSQINKDTVQNNPNLQDVLIPRLGQTDIQEKQTLPILQGAIPTQTDAESNLLNTKFQTHAPSIVNDQYSPVLELSQSKRSGDTNITDPINRWLTKRSNRNSVSQNSENLINGTNHNKNNVFPNDRHTITIPSKPLNSVSVKTEPLGKILLEPIIFETVKESETEQASLQIPRSNARMAIQNSPTNIARHPLAHTVLPQITSQIINRFNGQAIRFEIRLDPPELGRVDVKIEVGPDNKIQAVLAAREPAALNELWRGARILENALSDAGFNLDEQGLAFELATGHHADRNLFGDDENNDREYSDTHEDSNQPDKKNTVKPLPIRIDHWRTTRLDLIT